MRAVILMVCLVIGCSGGGGTGWIPPSAPTEVDTITDGGFWLNCGYQAHIACLALSQKYKTEIVYGTWENGEAHVQCRAKINGKWKWIDNPGIYITIGEHDGHPEETIYNNDQVYEFLASGLWK